MSEEASIKDPDIRRLIEAARPVAEYAKWHRHKPKDADARIPAKLVIALADALEKVEEAPKK